MYVPIPVLIVVGLAILGAITLLLSRRGGRDDDLMRPPVSLGKPRVAPPTVKPQIGAPAPAPGPAPAAPPDDALVMEVRMLLERGQKINAVKLARDRMPGAGLKEAKDWVEMVERGAE